MLKSNILHDLPSMKKSVKKRHGEMKTGLHHLAFFNALKSLSRDKLACLKKTPFPSRPSFNILPNHNNNKSKKLGDMMIPSV